MFLVAGDASGGVLNYLWCLEGNRLRPPLERRVAFLRAATREPALTGA